MHMPQCGKTGSVCITRGMASAASYVSIRFPSDVFSILTLYFPKDMVGILQEYALGALIWQERSTHTGSYVNWIGSFMHGQLSFDNCVTTDHAAAQYIRVWMIPSYWRQVGGYEGRSYCTANQLEGQLMLGHPAHLPSQLLYESTLSSFTFDRLIQRLTEHTTTTATVATMKTENDFDFIRIEHHRFEGSKTTNEFHEVRANIMPFLIQELKEVHKWIQKEIRDQCK